MKEADIPLVRGGKLTEEMIAWINRVSKHFPGVERELVTIRKPISASPRGRGIGITSAKTEEDMNETTKTNGGAVAVADDGGNISAYLDAHAGGTTYTRFKFAKDHRYRRVSDDEEVPLGKEFIVIYDQIMVGWIKFLEKGTPPESRMGRLFGGFMPCPRPDLGDTDQSLWELGLSGAPADPWLSQILLPLQAVADGELHLFGTTSITGRNAVGRVIDECRKMQRHDPDNYPVIKLALGSFQHRDERVGRVVVPAFPRIGKAPISGVAAATTSLADDMDDGIPEHLR
jgi:hypothetical protein